MAPRRSTPPDPQRQLMIKTKTCQRLIKECAYYKQEVKENQEKLENMIESGCDSYDIKKFREVLGESEMMCPDSEKRLQQAILDLQNFLAQESLETGGEANEEWYETAQRILRDYGTDATQHDNTHIEDRIETSLEGLGQDEIF